MRETITRRNFLKKSSKIVAVAGFGGCGILLKGCTSKKDFDIVIKGGHVFDGLGSEAVKTDIGIIGNSIKEIGLISSSKGKTVIDAKNLVLCPGQWKLRIFSFPCR
jgi:hypothetical protein